VQINEKLSRPIYAFVATDCSVIKRFELRNFSDMVLMYTEDVNPAFHIELLQSCHHRFGLLAMSSAKPDLIFWREKFEETLFKWLTWTTFLQIFSHP
jgi:hypothetical protein